MKSFQHSPDAEAIMQINKGVEAAIRDADETSVERLASIYTSEGQMLQPHGETLADKDAINSYWRGVLDAGITDANLETIELDFIDDTAIEVGSYLMKKGGAVADIGKYPVVWKKVNGQWKYHRDIWNSNLAT